MDKCKKKGLENKRIIIQGVIIYYLRKKYKWSLGELSRKSDLSSQYLSDIENGRKLISTVSFQEILDCFDMQFNEDADVENSVLELTMNSFEDYLIFGDKEILKELCCRLDDESLMCSYAFPHVYIWKCCLNMFLYDDYCYDGYLVEKLKYLLKQDEVALFHRFLAELHIENCCYEKAMVSLELAKDIVSSFIVRSYIYYNYSRVLAEMNNLSEAIKYSEEAMKNALLNQTYYLSNSIQINLANYYAKARRFEQAHLMLKKIKRFAKFTQNQELYLLYLRNELATYQDQGEYKKSNEIGIEYLKFKNDDQLILYLMAVNYFLLEKYEECNEYIQQIEKLNIDSKYILRWMDILKEGMKDKNSKEYYFLLKNHYELAKKEETVNEQIFILKLLIDYFERNKMYKKLSDYQRELLNLIK